MDFEDELMPDDEFAALDAVMSAAEASQGLDFDARLPDCTALTAAAQRSLPDAATAVNTAAAAAAAIGTDAFLVQTALQPVAHPPDAAAATKTSAPHPEHTTAAQHAPQRAAGATPARWGGCGSKSAELRGVAVFSPSMRASRARSRLSGHHSSSTVPSEAAGPVTIDEASAAELQAAEALERQQEAAQRDELPQLRLQLTPDDGETLPTSQPAKASDIAAIAPSEQPASTSAQPDSHPPVPLAAAPQLTGGHEPAALDPGGSALQPRASASTPEIPPPDSTEARSQLTSQPPKPSSSSKRTPGRVKVKRELQHDAPTISLFKGVNGQALLLPNPKLVEEPRDDNSKGKTPQKGRRGRKASNHRSQQKQTPKEQSAPGHPGQHPEGVAADQHRQTDGAAAMQRPPDLEDFGLMMDRLAIYRRRGLAVTDLTAAEWCQQQVAYTLSARIPKEELETEAMRAGTKHHAALEAETTVAVAVEVATWEDYWAVRLLNSVAGLQQLQQEGLTREVYIFGLIQGRWVRGIIDQLQLDGSGNVQVVEHKTRARPVLPRDAQARTTKLQVALYRAMLLGLPSLSNDQLDAFLQHALRVDASNTLSSPVVQHAEAMAGQPAQTMRHVARLLRSAAAALKFGGGGCGDADAAMFVRYWWQGDGEMFAELPVEAAVEWLLEATDRHMRFWSGATAPQPVVKEESWKCSYCAFRQQCPAVAQHASLELCR